MLHRACLVAVMTLSASAGAFGESLIEAIRNGETEKARAIGTNDPAQINRPNEHGSTPLHWCSIRGDTATATYLIERGAKVNAADNYGLTPLHRAAYWGKHRVAELLLQHGADASLRDKEDRTALDWARIRKNARVTELIEKHLAQRD